MISNDEGRFSGLFGQISDPHALTLAFEKVRRNNGCAGGDGQSIAAFAAKGAAAIARLSGLLRNGNYAPRPLRLHEIPKPDGGTRRLAIPAVSDRIVQTAVAAALTPRLEPLFSPDSYGYRPGRSVAMAVDRISALRRMGYTWVVEADIEKAFDRIPHDPVLEALDTALDPTPGNRALIDLVGLWLAHGSGQLGTPGRGLAQGSPLSPLLSNLFFDGLDDRFDSGAARIVRFADDFVILARSEAGAETARALAEEFVAGHGLRMVSRETRVVGFDRGFQFLGQLFVRSLVLPAPDEPDPDASAVMRELAEADEATAEAVAGYDPGARVLYLVEPERRLSLRAESFAVLDGGGSLLLSLPPARVNRIELGPGAVVDDPVWRHALATDTTLAFLDGHGETKGYLAPPQPAEAELQLAQAALVLHPERRLALARVLVGARLRNQRARLAVLNRSAKATEVDRAIAALGRAIRGLAAPMPDLDSLRGVEGHAARIYWPALARLCTAHKGPFLRERPAKTPLNAAINYLTALLARDIRAALIGAGLHPGFGVLHQAQDRGDAAVYDLMEVFRATLSEGLAVSLFNRRRLRDEMFEPQGDSLRILTPGRRALITGYEEALERVIRSSQTRQRHALRRIMLEEARALARHCRSPETMPYLPQMQDY